jgi:hypothetical protein
MNTMFENITIQLLEESHEESGGKLMCLPLSRSLLDAFERLGLAASPLVIRGVVFGKQEDPTIFRKVGFQQLVTTAFNGPRANGWMDLDVTDGGERKTVRLHYRTIGQPHDGEPGDKTLGNYDADGNWLGHLAVVADGVLIDPSIGQLNDERYKICFDPPALTAPASDVFLSGKEPLVFGMDGMLVGYFAYPDERTFESSRSWTNAEFRAQLKAIGERTAAPFEGKESSDLHASE